MVIFVILSWVFLFHSKILFLGIPLKKLVIPELNMGDIISQDITKNMKITSYEEQNAHHKRTKMDIREYKQQ